MRSRRAPKIREILALSAILLAAVAATTPTTRKDTGPLAGTSWRLLRFRSGDDTVLAAPDPSKYTIFFGRDGRANVRVDCNRGAGSWKWTAPSGLEFGPLALTRAMCPPAPLTDRFARDLSSVRSYVLKDGHLFLSLMADGGIYEFEPSGTRAGEGALDCAKADSEIEKTICGDPSLVAADRKLAPVYAAALRKAGTASERFKVDQAAWLEKRDACAAQKDPKTCLAQAYAFRTAELQARTRQAATSGAATFRCTPAGEIVATFYRTDPPSAILEKDGKAAFALSAPSGSGTRYEGPDVQFREKGGEAQVTWFGAKLSCSSRKR